jgi:hypothetical protein
MKKGGMLMFELEDIKKYHKMHNQVQDTIDQIVHFYNEINNRDDDIESVRSTYDGFAVEVYQWVGGGYSDSSTIDISIELFTNDELLKQLEQQAEKAKSEKELLKKEREAETTNRKIEEAMRLLKEHGKI